MFGPSARFALGRSFESANPRHKAGGSLFTCSLRHCTVAGFGLKAIVRVVERKLILGAMASCGCIVIRRGLMMALTDGFLKIGAGRSKSAREVLVRKLFLILHGDFGSHMRYEIVFDCHSLPGL